MLASLLFAAALAAEPPNEDMNAAAAYVQSHYLPAIFAACKQAFPRRAAEYDQALERWSKANRKVVDYGEKVSRAQAKAQGMELEAMIAQSVADLRNDMAGKTPEEMDRGCANALQGAWAESQQR
ncbi:MAG TPA: hypothetical protein VJ724_02045 [Tahibacter sp.]|nr:hypothetical protein [Tahibacter sp.]